MKMSNITTDEEMADHIAALRKNSFVVHGAEEFSYPQHEAACKFRERFNDAINRMIANPVLAGDRTLAAAEAIAMNSPFSDINDPATAYQHDQTAAQDVCLYAIHALTRLARAVPGRSEAVVGILSRLAENSLDYKIRSEAVMSTWSVGCTPGPLRQHAVDALVREGHENSNQYIRQLARDRLFDMGRERNEVVSTVIEAFRDGAMNDAVPENRARSYGGLSVAVESLPLSEAQLTELSTLFKAAANVEGDKYLKEAAKLGLDLTDARLAKPGHPAPHPYQNTL